MVDTIMIQNTQIMDNLLSKFRLIITRLQQAPTDFTTRQLLTDMAATLHTIMVLQDRPR